ncbi:MAG TPA: ATP-binding protein [Chloroflexota bacterium]
MVLDESIAPPMEAPAGAPARILVIDDEETVLLSIQGVLELDGYQVAATTSGVHALELAHSEFFDLVLTDLRLADKDGLELLSELQRISPESVTITLTGYASLDTALIALRQGAYDYLIKPCDIIQLRNSVKRGLERSRLAIQLSKRVSELEQANETIRALNLELEQRVERATADLREQITARDEFMATVSHDLKSPLTFIKGMANLRRRRAVAVPETAPLVDALEQIESGAGRMAQMLDELVDAGRLEAGRPLELRRDMTDLVELARQTIAEYQQTTDRHVLHLQADVPDLVGIWDRVRLGRVLDNLVGNAVKYTPRGGTIEVRVDLEQQPDRWAVLRISDSGEGIPESDLPHIFERFRRGRNVEGRIPGTGIGLSGVRSILEQHGGSIAVESAVGQGTTVTVRLPLKSA